MNKIIQLKFYIFLLLILFCNVNVFAKPRCEIFYDKVYNIIIKFKNVWFSSNINMIKEFIIHN